ncbi:hypothetical protein [Solimonas marina]|uniref:Uncharacterized protein n=1 Tax=Solimonas marina TaxID=2714601 RepID=A0A969WBW1_9GAMM|nr:hypothetical protein [Solimonas marina]NKF23260.1 hypothetical protein [Solimonas marina]
MNSHSDSRADTHRDDEDAWLRQLLREDGEQAPHLDDAGFTMQVLQTLPPPRDHGPDWIGGLVMIGMLGFALLFVTGLLVHPADHAAELAGHAVRQLFAHLLDFRLDQLWPWLGMLLALGFTGTALLDD